MSRSKKIRKFKRFWGEYWVEVVAVVAVITGVVIVKFDKSFWAAAYTTIEEWYFIALDFLLQFNRADVIGVMAAVVGLVVVIWRFRYHVSRSEYWRLRQCPRCGSTLHRIHRTFFDRLLGFFFLPHSRRFRCDNPECRWSGLRYGRHIDDSSEFA